ncbi:ImmA/IrrE family metallo-endopeptidase [Rhizobium ruizarguesonis]
MTEHRPIPTRASKDRIHAFAENIADQLSFGPGDDIEPLIRRLGGKIEVKNPLNYAGPFPESIVVRASTDFTIFVPSLTSVERDRFTIAHELGHLALHYPVFSQKYPGEPMVATRWVDENDQDQKRAEWEANWFAGGFLMNGAVFRETFAGNSGNLALVALRFGVSKSAAEVRAKNLQLA